MYKQKHTHTHAYTSSLILSDVDVELIVSFCWLKIFIYRMHLIRLRAISVAIRSFVSSKSTAVCCDIVENLCFVLKDAFLYGTMKYSFDMCLPWGIHINGMSTDPPVILSFSATRSHTHVLRLYGCSRYYCIENSICMHIVFVRNWSQAATPKRRTATSDLAECRKDEQTASRASCTR